jgi:hypothetical protein
VGVKKKNFCVIIPVHTKGLNAEEKQSLNACFAILSSYPIYLLKPQSLDVTNYIEIAPNLIIQSVPDEWMASWGAYNLMKRSLEFYKKFEQYEFMLTYELDCIIFSDNWESCNFIGAPWFDALPSVEFKNTPVMKQGMNSGFSLRNVKKCIKILETISSNNKTWKIYSSLHLHRLFKLSGILKFFNPLWKSGSNVFFFELMNPTPIHEDYFWTVIIPKMFKFNIATAKDAVNFSFEEYPSYLYELNNKTLPVGCHAWKKYEPEFWLKILKNNE